VSRILPFMAVLLAVAFFTRVNFFFYLFYSMAGIYFLGRLWASRSLAAVKVERHHEPRMFYGESLAVRLEVHNRGWLPVLAPFAGCCPCGRGSGSSTSIASWAGGGATTAWVPW